MQVRKAFRNPFQFRVPKAAGQRIQQWLQFGPRLADQHMVVYQSLGHLYCLGIAARAQGGNDVALLILVVRRRSHGEIAQHVASAIACTLVRSLCHGMLDQATQELQRTSHPVMAGRKHLERLLEGGSGLIRAWWRDPVHGSLWRQPLGFRS